MEIFYCDACGHRIPDAHFGSGTAQRIDDKAYCSKCPRPAPQQPPPAVNATAITADEIIPATASMSRSPAAGVATIRERESSTTTVARRTTTLRPRPVTTLGTRAQLEQSNSGENVKAASSKSGASRQQSLKSKLIVFGSCGVALLALVLVIVFSGSKKVEKVEEVPPTAVRSKGPESNVKSPASSVPVAPLNTAPKLPDQKAFAEVHEKFKALKKDDYAKKIELLNAFVEQFSDSNLATQALQELKDLRDASWGQEQSTLATRPVNPTPNSVPPVQQPAPAPMPDLAKAPLPAPPGIPAVANAAGRVTWMMNLTLADAQSHLTQGVKMLAAKAVVAKATPTGNAEHAEVIEFTAAKDESLFTITEATILSMDIYLTGTEHIQIRITGQDSEGKMVELFGPFPELKRNEWIGINNCPIANNFAIVEDGKPVGKAKAGLAVRSIQFLSGPTKADFYLGGLYVSGVLPGAHLVAPAASVTPVTPASDPFETQAAEALELLKANLFDTKKLKEDLAAWQTKFGKTKCATANAVALQELAARTKGLEEPALNSNPNPAPTLLANNKIELKEKLVGYWQLNESSGSKTVVDVVAEGHPGKIVPNVTWSLGILGGAASFDGGTGLIDIPGIGASNELTVSCWVRHSPKAPAGKVERYLTLDDECAVLKRDAKGLLTFKVKTDKGEAPLSSKDPVANDKWVLATGTWDGTIQKLYKDGVLIEQQTPGGSIKSAKQELKLGGATVQGLNGLLDDVRVYHRALTPEEVLALYELGVPSVNVKKDK